MTDQEMKEYLEVVRRANALSPSLRLSIAQTLLNSLEEELRPPSRRRVPLNQLLNKMKKKMKGPPPDDKDVRRIIHEHRMEKYG